MAPKDGQAATLAPPGRAEDAAGAPRAVLVVASLFPHAKNETLGLSTCRRTVELARLCEVKVLALTTRSDLAEREVLGGVEVVRPRWRRVPKLGLVVDGYRYAARAARALREMLPAFDFDLIDAHWLYPDGFAAVRLAARLGKPVAVTGRGSDVNDFCFRWPVRHYARRALREATHLFAVSRQLARRMADAGAPAERITVVHNGVDTALFCPGDRDAARRELGLPPDGTLLVSAGSMVEDKGFQHLIAGLALLPPGRSVRLYVAGPGPYRGTLERLAQDRGVADRVSFLGRVTQQQMPLWYRAADFFCFASLKEGCPNVILEALACGTPVVSTNVGGIPDLVEEGQDGVLFEPGSAEPFAAALERALARPWDRGGIAARGSRRSWGHVAAEYYRAFGHLLARRSPERGT